VRTQVISEIALLEARAEQLGPIAKALSAEVSVAASAVDAADETDDAILAKLQRRLQLLRARHLQVAAELKTLRELAEARRARYGIPASEAHQGSRLR
jgi:hypothetical protein